MYNFEEINLHRDAGKLLNLVYLHGQTIFGDESNPDVSTLNAMIQGGACRAFGIYSASIGYVGYCFYTVTRDLFRAHKIKAECLAIYVDKDFRGNAANNLLKFAEETLRESGVDFVYTSGNTNERITKWYMRKGYRVVNYHLCKEL